MSSAEVTQLVEKAVGAMGSKPCWKKYLTPGLQHLIPWRAIVILSLSLASIFISALIYAFSFLLFPPVLFNPSSHHSHQRGLWAASLQPMFPKSLDWGAPMRQQLIPVSVICLSSSIESYNKPQERDINEECRLITPESVENCVKMAQQ